MLRRLNEGGERQGAGRICERWAKITVKTFPIKKRINTELFIDMKWRLYIQKKRRNRISKIDQDISDLSEEGKDIGGK